MLSSAYASTCEAHACAQRAENPARERQCDCMQRGYLLARQFVVLVSENTFLRDEIRIMIMGIHVWPCDRARKWPDAVLQEPAAPFLSARQAFLRGQEVFQHPNLLFQITGGPSDLLAVRVHAELIGSGSDTTI